jgi:hypothetical protein
MTERQTIPLLANQFELTLSGSIYKYHLSAAVQRRAFFRALPDLKPALLARQTLYTPVLQESQTVTVEDKEVEVTFQGPLSDPQEFLNLVGRRFKMAQKALKMQPIGKKYFNP